MKEDKKNKDKKKESFFAGIFRKIDKKLEEKSGEAGCCCDSDKKDGNSCC